MSDRPTDLRRMSDDDLIEDYRRLKTETGGADPSLTLPKRESASAVRDEMDRRGLSPDREDVVPDEASPFEDPIVEDRA